MRPSKDATWLEVCATLAKRSTCLRRHLGCVLIDARGHVLSTGYNGVAPGEKHCNEVTGTHEELAPIGDLEVEEYAFACPAAGAKPGQNLDGCRAIHAEQNALLQCRDPWQIWTCYCTASPCITCVKLLMSTSCTRVVFIEEYPHVEARTLWGGREWVHAEM